MSVAGPKTLRALAALAAGALGIVGSTSPADAAETDAPQPSDYRSTITAIRPSSDGVEIEITGGDAFLALRAAPGHEVVVLGYDDEPYLRFRPDGTVEANLESPATYVNASLSGTAEVPPGVDADEPARWERVGDGGTYAWHDHRIHWMGSQRPVGVPRGGEVHRWTVPLRIDDEPVTVEGVLTLAPVAWWPWLLAVAAVAAVTWTLGRRPGPGAVGMVAVGAVGMACVVAVSVAVVEQVSVPAEAGRRLLPVLVPACGAVAAVVALGLRPVRRRPTLARNLGLAAVATALGWALLRLAVFTKPVLVTDLQPDLDRAGTAVALGLALAAAALLTARPTGNR
jgi:hypothetical protein